jgi:hypothetical protein
MDTFMPQGGLNIITCMLRSCAAALQLATHTRGGKGATGLPMIPARSLITARSCFWLSAS